MDEAQTAALLAGLSEGAEVEVVYEAGGERTPRAEREASRARLAGADLQRLRGRYVGSWRNQRGELYFTILTPDRDDERTGEQEAYRSINPSVGNLRALQAL